MSTHCCSNMATSKLKIESCQFVSLTELEGVLVGGKFSNEMK